jgi:hypothetical protein
MKTESSRLKRVEKLEGILYLSERNKIPLELAFPGVQGIMGSLSS